MADSSAPDWLQQLDSATQEWFAEGAPELHCPQLELVRMDDREYPDRICAWCFHPRNSVECNFAKEHTPYREMFGGDA